MEKISFPQVEQMMKIAADNLRALSDENVGLKDKLAHFEKKERVEKIAHKMEEKGLNPALSFDEKVAHLLAHEKIEVIEEAVTMSSPQMKIASLVDGIDGVTDGIDTADHAATLFAQNLASN